MTTSKADAFVDNLKDHHIGFSPIDEEKVNSLSNSLSVNDWQLLASKYDSQHSKDNGFWIDQSEPGAFTLHNDEAKIAQYQHREENYAKWLNYGGLAVAGLGIAGGYFGAKYLFTALEAQPGWIQLGATIGTRIGAPVLGLAIGGGMLVDANRLSDNAKINVTNWGKPMKVQSFALNNRLLG